ncbi:MAG: hypothetical protein WA799_03775 [Nitrosotalea sp.]
MKIGNYFVPEMRLNELLANTLKKIYSHFKTEAIQSKDLAGLLGYKYGTEPTLFRKIHSMIAYGVLEGRGVYSITKLGENLLYPENPEIEKQLKTNAVMNVELWRKLYEKHGMELPKESLWVSIRSITGVDPETAKIHSNRVYKWYMDDMASISKEYVLIEQDTTQEEPLRSNTPIVNKEQSMSQSLEKQTISFANKYSITLPKGDVKTEYEKFEKYMKLYLENEINQGQENTTSQS